MSYTPTTWATGDVITAEKLNNMESGIANAGGGGVRIMIANITYEEDTWSCDKTAAEMKSFFDGGGLVYASFDFSPSHLIPLYSAFEPPGTVVVQFIENNILLHDDSVSIENNQIAVSRSEGEDEDIVFVTMKTATVQATIQ